MVIFDYYKISLTLRRPKKHEPHAPDVLDLAKTVKPWSELFKIFTNVFAGATNKYPSTSKAVFNNEKKFEIR